MHQNSHPFVVSVGHEHMELAEQIEFTRDLIPCRWCPFGIQTLCCSANGWIQKPCRIEFRDTDKRAYKVVDDDVDIKTTCDSIISQEYEDLTIDQFGKDRCHASLQRQ